MKTSLLFKVAVGIGFSVAPIVVLSGMASAADPSVIAWGQSQGAAYDASFDGAAQQVAIQSSVSVTSAPQRPAGALGVTSGTGPTPQGAVAGLMVWGSGAASSTFQAGLSVSTRSPSLPRLR